MNFIKLFLLTTLGFTPFIKTYGVERSLELVDVSKEASRADWQYFHAMPEGDWEKWWVYHADQGRQLGNWSWSWRMGWVQRCGRAKAGFCPQLLKTALFDRAMVVRASAATVLGERFEGSGNKEILNLLTKAYALPQNNRHGKPLPVQFRILFAIKQVGGDGAKQIGQQLVQSGSKTKAYWESIW